MALGGLGASLAHRLMLKKKQRCERCQSFYDKELADCPYCSHLDEHGLAKLLAEREDELEANSNLGSIFIIIAIIFAGLFLAFLL